MQQQFQIQYYVVFWLLLNVLNVLNCVNVLILIKLSTRSIVSNDVRPVLTVRNRVSYI
jgi:hypothetical protein